MKLSKSLTTVTPFSKFIAMILFIILPFAGFYFGMEYQNKNFIPETKNIKDEKVINIPAVETRNDLINRCGDIPSENLKIAKKDKFYLVQGPDWSPDCRHIAWSLNISAPQGWFVTDQNSQPAQSFETLNSTNDEGIFIYSDSTKKITRIYIPKIKKEAANFVKWANSSSLVYTVNYDTGNKQYYYNLESGNVTIK